MRGIKLFPRKELQAKIAEVEAYSRKLASPEKVNFEQTVGCHLAKLVLEKDREVRVRSMQTIVDDGALTVLSPAKKERALREVLPPAIKEMVLVSRKWPDPKQTNLAYILASVIQKCGSIPLD